MTNACEIRCVSTHPGGVEHWQADDGRLFRFQPIVFDPIRFEAQEETIGAAYLEAERAQHGWTVKLTPAGERSPYADALLKLARQALKSVHCGPGPHN